MKWEPVPRGSRNGPLTGYYVRYRLIFSNGSDGEIKMLLCKKSANNITLTELEKASVYRIDVAGVTFTGTGVYSEPVTAKTCKFQTA